MTLASFTDLCLDASDTERITGFWRFAVRADEARMPYGPRGPRQVDPAWTGNSTLWINPVPEPPSSTKARVHVDLRLTSPEPDALVAAGATVVRPPGRDPWWSMADPEGNEFCAFPPKDGGSTGPGPVFELVVDSADPEAQVEWWAGVVGGVIHREERFSYLTGATGFPFESWVFQAVPEPKTVKNRLHWDVDLRGARPDDLLAAGARLLRAPDEDITWWILADPEGNEFCAFPGA